VGDAVGATATKGCDASTVKNRRKGHTQGRDRRHASWNGNKGWAKPKERFEANESEWKEKAKERGLVENIRGQLKKKPWVHMKEGGK
jgi:hypothetical protein